MELVVDIGIVICDFLLTLFSDDSLKKIINKFKKKN